MRLDLFDEVAPVCPRCLHFSQAIASLKIAERAQGEHYAHTDDAEQQRRAERIALASLKFLVLDYSRKTSFQFDPEASIDFEGRTGAYCLYNYARTQSLLRKAKADPSIDSAILSTLSTELERRVLLRLAEFESSLLFE